MLQATQHRLSRSVTTMGGTVYIDNSSGRALRKRAADVRASDVLYSGGGFRAGEQIEIAFRSADGAQYVIAAGIARCAEATLLERSGMPLAWEIRNSRLAPANDFIVVAAADLRPYWPASAEA